MSSDIAILIATFLAAVLSGLGVGSAGLFVLYLTFFAGFSQAEAQALNLAFFLLSAGAALLLHIRERSIPPRLVLYLVACALPGALLGSFLAGRTDPSLLRRLFGGMLVLTGGYTLLKRDSHRSKTSLRDP